MTMIELHSVSNNEPIWINVDRIISIERCTTINNNYKKNFTEIWSSDESSYFVTETPDQIKTATGITIIKCHESKHSCDNKKKFKPRNSKHKKDNSKRRTPYSGFEFK